MLLVINKSSHINYLANIFRVEYWITRKDSADVRPTLDELDANKTISLIESDKIRVFTLGKDHQTFSFSIKSYSQ